MENQDKDMLTTNLSGINNQDYSRNTSTDSYEVQLDVVDRLSWLNVDVANKLIAVNNFWRIVWVIANNAEVIDTTTTLYES